MKKVFGHPNVIKLLEVFENSKYVFCVMEYALKGDLLSYLKKKKFIKEKESKLIFYQICLGVRYMHSNGVVHRDIKLDNILIDEKEHCKLCDFGVSRFIQKDEKIYEKCGTPAYLAPEIIKENGYSGFKVDIWSLGVLLFCLVTGKMPFRADTLEKLHKNICSGEFNYENEANIDQSAKNLISKMLVVDPDKRIDINDVLEAEWLKSIDT